MNNSDYNPEYEDYAHIRSGYKVRLTRPSYTQDEWYDEVVPEDSNEINSISRENFDIIIDAIDSGETPEWLILKGDPAKKAAAKEWVEARKRIAWTKKEAEDKRKLEELREQALAKLSKEERAALGI